MIEWRLHPDAEAMADAVCMDMGAIISDALLRRESALLALPGGKTPVAVVEKLAHLPLDWSEVMIIPGDDRLVAEDSPLSNAAMLKAAFAPTAAMVLPLAAPEDEYHRAGEMANEELAMLDWPPDLVWLGMGLDGHTASIFPGPDLDAALSPPDGVRAVGVLPDPLPPEAPVARITLTRPAICAARQLRVVIAGADKRAILERALLEGAQSALPIGRVLADCHQPLVIHWCP